MQHIQHNGGKHNEILVQDIMSTKLEVLYIKDVSRSRIGDIVRTLHDVDRHHAIVIDHQGQDNRPTVRGIISLSQIARLLGKSVDDFTIDKMVEHILN